MEFFATPEIRASAAQLQARLSIPALTGFCASISQILRHPGDQGDDSGEIYCLWGQFPIQRELLRDGVRFSLPTCPNALQWTITTDPAAPETNTLIHLTINRQAIDADFAESIELFVEDWKKGLELATWGPDQAS